MNNGGEDDLDGDYHRAATRVCIGWEGCRERLKTRIWNCASLVIKGF